MLGDEGGAPWLWSLLTPQVLIVLAIVVTVLVGVLLGLAVWGVRRARRSGALARGRRAVERAQLTLRAQTAPPGPARELAQLRLDLREVVGRTSTAVTATQAAGDPVGDLPGLCRRLQQVTVALDTELRLLEHDPDGADVRVLLPALRARAGELEGSARAVRDAAAAARHGMAEASLAELTADVDQEVAALRAGVAAISGRGGPPPTSTPGG